MDLADQIDDYICSFEGLGDLTMDSLAMFIFLWAVLALFSVWLCKLLYQKYLNKGATNPASASNSRQSSVAPGGSGAASGAGGKTEKRLSEPRDLLATKSKVDDLSKAAPVGGAGSGGRGRSTASPIGGAGAVAGPRRRMVRQSSTGPENRKKRYVPPPSNVVGPETVSKRMKGDLNEELALLMSCSSFSEFRHLDEPSVPLALQRSGHCQRAAHVLGDCHQRYTAQICRGGESGNDISASYFDFDIIYDDIIINIHTHSPFTIYQLPVAS